MPRLINANVPLAPRTTLQVGGSALLFAQALTVDDLRAALHQADAAALPVVVLGGGSNMLVSDGGFDGMVVMIDFYRLEVEAIPGRDTVRLHVGAGVEWDELVEFAMVERLSGLECLSGIPGRAGAAPIQNIGAYGAELGDVLEAVDAYDRLTGLRVRLPASLCQLGYRSSRFKRDWRDRYVVLGLELALRRGGAVEIRYEELARALGVDAGARVTDHAEIRRTVLALRRRKSMVIDPGDPNHRSAGSFFVNPIVEPDLAAQVAGVASERGLGDVPGWDVAEGRKLSAGWLIEQAGFGRGHIAGEAGLSSRHALALINRGQARAAEIVALARQVRLGVFDRFGVLLEPEPVFVGFSDTMAELLGARA